MTHYFAYGSNMDRDDFKKWYNKEKMAEKGYTEFKFRNPRPAKLSGYKLCFNYCSKRRDGGAANIMESREDCVYGLLFDIEHDELKTIRKKEGYSEDCPNCYYNEVCVNAELFSDKTKVEHVKTYKVSKCREKPDHQRPTKEYMCLIIKKAKIHGFPSEYIRFLESIPTKSTTND